MALTDHATETRDTATLDAGWYPDPEQVHQMRYFDGDAWTSHVTHNGPLPCHGCHHPGRRRTDHN